MVNNIPHDTDSRMNPPFGRRTLTGGHLAVLLEYGQMGTHGKLNNRKGKVLKRSVQPRSH